MRAAVFDTTLRVHTQPSRGSATGGTAALPEQPREEEGGGPTMHHARTHSVGKSQPREEEGGGRSRGTREKVLRAALQLAATRLRYAAEIDPESWPLQVRVAIIGHFNPCMTDIYLHIDARMADYIRTHA